MILDTSRIIRSGQRVVCTTVRLHRIPIATMLLCLLLLVGLCAHAHASDPMSKQGRLPTGKEVLLSEGITRLSGDWEFYWEHLYDPEDFVSATPPLPDAHVRVPGGWNAVQLQGQTLPGYGYATYRLEFDVDLLHEPLALYIPYQQTAYRMWINGELVAQNGVVATERERYTPEYRSVLARFTPTSPRVELVVQIANFAHRVGGMWNSPMIGKAAHVETWLLVRLSVKLLLIGGFGIIALYHFFLYGLRRETAKPALLGLFGLCIATRTMIMGDHILESLLDISWEWQLRVEYVAGFAAIGAVTELLRATWPHEVSRTVVQATLLACTGLVFITLFFPVELVSRLLPSVLVGLSILIVYFIGAAILALTRNRPGSAIFFGGGIILVITVGFDILLYHRLTESVNLIPFGYLALLMSQALIQAQEFAQALRNEAALVKALKASRRLLSRADEKERREVSEFLHSHVQTRLNLIMHKLRLAGETLKQGGEPPGRCLDDIYDEINEVRENDIRRASHLLHPSVVDIGLLPAVRSLASQFADAFQISVNAAPEVTQLDRLDLVADTRTAPRIPPSLRLCAYRIVEECLGNIRKHAQARLVVIDIGIESTRALRLSVSDDGKGFEPPASDPSATVAGLGLRMMEARAAEAGGTLTLRSTPGQGTTVTLILPLGERPSKVLQPKGTNPDKDVCESTQKRWLI